MTESCLRTETQNGVRWLILNRPAKRNALNQELIAALLDALERADSEVEIGCVALAAEGDVFCAGADIGEIKAAAQLTPEEVGLRQRRTAKLQSAGADMSKPVVAAVHGAAIGLGAALVLAADFVVMAQSARLSFPEVKKYGRTPIGVMPLVARAAAPKLAFELLALGDELDATQALSRGLINRIAADTDLRSDARVIAERLAGYDRGAMSLTKQLLRQMLDLSLEEMVAVSAGASLKRAARSAQS